MKLLRTLTTLAVVAFSMTACLKDKSADVPPAETTQPAAAVAPTAVPAQDAQPTEAAPTAAPADTGSTQSNH